MGRDKEVRFVHTGYEIGIEGELKFITYTVQFGDAPPTEGAVTPDKTHMRSALFLDDDAKGFYRVHFDKRLNKYYIVYDGDQHWMYDELVQLIDRATTEFYILRDNDER